MATKTDVTDADSAKPVDNMTESWAEKRPNAVALVEGEREVTFAELNSKADALAEGLTRQGIDAGDIIVIRTQIRWEWAVIAVAAAKLGCRILGLNWYLTASEVRHVMSNSGGQVVFCDDQKPADLLPGLADLPLKLKVSMDVSDPAFVEFSDLLVQDAPRRFSQADAPLIVYTSGTTGLPKGVVMAPSAKTTMEEFMEYVASMGKSRPVLPGDVVMASLPMHHGAGPSTVRGSLAAGNKTILQRRFDPEEAFRLIDRHKVTFWTGVPTMYKRMAALPADVIGRYDVSSIRSLAIGAAPVPYVLKEWIIETFGEVLYESYGATEVGMISDLAPHEQRLKPGSSGKPHVHVHLEVRDEDGNVLPAGQGGEFWIKTPMTIGNYLNAAALGDDTLDERGFFKVGDFGHVDQDGYIFITDRVKDMIISGGVNIYPAEIEAALIGHPDIQDVAIIGIPDDEFGEKIMAFVELRGGATMTAEELIAYSADHLAAYKRPKVVEFRDELPRNTMGKLLKRELREPYWKDRARAV